MNWKILPTPQHIAEEFSRQLDELSIKGGVRHIIISGGSTPKIWFTNLATPPWIKKICWENIHFWWADERCVPPENPESNFGEANKLLFRHINIPKKNLHRIRGEAPPVEEARRYAKEIDQFVGKNSQGIAVFDWIHLGIGSDGHTASLFPGQTNYNDAKWVTVARHPESGQQRITTTALLLTASNRISYQVTGKSKAELLQKIQKERENNPQVKLPWPAANIHSKTGETEWYIDMAAATLLT